MGSDVAAARRSFTSPDAALAESGAPLLFEDLYLKYYSDVFRYALVLTNTPEEAEDVAAETFARAWHAWNRARDPLTPPLPWLLVIARNIATDAWRRMSRLSRHMLAAQPPDDHAEVEALLWLRALVQMLPPRQREVIVLRYLRDLSDADIARLMNLGESGVRSLASRAITTLRQHPEVWR